MHMGAETERWKEGGGGGGGLGGRGRGKRKKGNNAIKSFSSLFTTCVRVRSCKSTSLKRMKAVLCCVYIGKHVIVCLFDFFFNLNVCHTVRRVKKSAQLNA